MNNSTRKHIATYSDEKLEAAIEKDAYRLEHSKLGHLNTIRRSIATRLQALVDEKQARMIGGHAFY